MQKRLDFILIYLTQNEGKPVVSGRFVRSLQGKIYKKNDKY